MLWSELEDIYDERDLSTFLLDKFGVTLTSSSVETRHDFSTRMKGYFEASGKHWIKSVESNLKKLVCEYVCSDEGPDPALSSQELLESLSSGLERKLKSADSARSKR